MIGNDIVDLKQASLSSNWKRPRWLQKVCTEEEQELISQSETPDATVWRLWSMKESAYKCYVQQFGKLSFNAKNLNCEFLSYTKGIVTILGTQFFTTSSINRQYIHTTASLHNNLQVYSKICVLKGTDPSQISLALKEAALKTISTISHLPVGYLQIEKTELQVPKVLDDEGDLYLHLSLSHHGNYGAFAIADGWLN